MCKQCVLVVSLLVVCVRCLRRDAHGSGTGGYGSEPSVPVLEIVEPEPNCEGVSRLLFRFQIRRL